MLLEKALTVFGGLGECHTWRINLLVLARQHELGSPPHPITSTDLTQVGSFWASGVHWMGSREERWGLSARDELFSSRISRLALEEKARTPAKSASFSRSRKLNLPMSKDGREGRFKVWSSIEQSFLLISTLDLVRKPRFPLPVSSLWGFTLNPTIPVHIPSA